MAALYMYILPSKAQLGFQLQSSCVIEKCSDKQSYNLTV